MNSHVICQNTVYIIYQHFSPRPIQIRSYKRIQPGAAIQSCIIQMVPENSQKILIKATDFTKCIS